MCAATLLPWLNFIVLFLTLVCVALYLSETRAIRIANEAQLEAQIRPALTVGSKGAGLGMFNVGNGAALNLQIVRTKGEEIDWAAKTNFGMRLAGAAIAPGESEGMGEVVGFMGALKTEHLLMTYESLSGRNYASVIMFTGTGQVADTRLVVKT